MTHESDFATVDAFKAALKVWRQKPAWIFYSGKVAGRAVQIKTWRHTYLQIFRIDGANQHLPPMDCKVRDFDAAITRAFAPFV